MVVLEFTNALAGLFSGFPELAAGSFDRKLCRFFPLCFSLVNNDERDDSAETGVRDRAEAVEPEVCPREFIARALPAIRSAPADKHSDLFDEACGISSSKGAFPLPTFFDVLDLPNEVFVRQGALAGAGELGEVGNSSVKCRAPSVLFPMAAEVD